MGNQLLTQKQKAMFKQGSMLALCIFNYIAILYLELVLRIYTGGGALGFLYTCLLSLPMAIIFTFLSSLGKYRINRTVSLVLLSVATAIFFIQTVYYTVFDTYFTIYSFAGTGKIMQFWRDILDGIAHAWLPMLLSLLPLIAWIFLGRRLVPRKRPQGLDLLQCGGAVVLTHMLALIIILASNSGVMSTHYLYNNAFILDLSVDRFGLVTTTRLDARNLLFPRALTATGEDDGAQEQEEEIIYANNIMEIDFDSLLAAETNETIRTMHEYFKQVEPTKQNAYTGMFKGKNLIWICAEGFSSWAIHPEKTPTLYKMSKQGFVFNSFYNPIWGVSTSDGEYTTTTGLLPKSGVWSYYRSGKNAMPLAMGHQLSRLGYGSRAYHNHSYDYYRRDVSHPNMGYDYKGYGNGLNVTWQWPESDLEMMELTIAEYIGSEPFHTYYMTVSGHLEYNFGGNMMSKKHQDDVADLPYSEAFRAYIACNMEFDQAMAYLLAQLEEAGVLDNTLIAISGDHYPYGLTMEQITELNGGGFDSELELYHSTFILWSKTIPEPIVVDKPCDAIDILPTLSNLMGLEYDSRILMGRDILAEEEGLVVFSDHSWITDRGRYVASSDTFTPNEGVEVDEEYATRMMNHVNQLFDYSAKILDMDYYAYVLPNW